MLRRKVMSGAAVGVKLWNSIMCGRLLCLGRLYYLFLLCRGFIFDCLLGYKDTLGISQTQQRVFKGQISKAIGF